MKEPTYSVIVPVYNRPEEVAELLQSLTRQEDADFEVLVVEDGSTDRCESIVNQYRDQLTIFYFFKPNSGPGPSRNFGFQHARGKFFVVFDSDCIVPPGYFTAVGKALAARAADAWGGPDRAVASFTAHQQAMGYTMSSLLTTGGIRGGKKHLGWFQPRSFNMGISRQVFEKTGGFAFDRYAEDIELSIRMKRMGFNVILIPEAYVFHKRRNTWSAFFRQVYHFGRGRILVGRKYPEEVKFTHWFPALFVMACLALPLTWLVHRTLFFFGAAVISLYLTAIFFHAWLTTKRAGVALLSVPSACLQLWGYGLGFLRERMKPLRS